MHAPKLHIADAHALSVPIGRVIFEIGGTPIREELAREGAFLSVPSLAFSCRRLVPALRQAANKLPTKMEFINRQTPARLGNMLIVPETPAVSEASAEARTVQTA